MPGLPVFIEAGSIAAESDVSNGSRNVESTHHDQMRVERTPAPLRQQVVDSMRSAITSGHFRPGDRLIERELCEATGVSRTLVREALRQLETEGLVKVLPNKGPVVASIELEEALEIYKVRSVLEALASQLFAEKAAPAQVSALKQAAKNFAAACRAKDPAEAGRAKNELYRVLFAGCGNAVLQGQLNQLFARTSLLRSVTLSSPGRLAESQKEIALLVDALVAKKPQDAWDASLAHVHNAARVLAGVMAQSAVPVSQTRRSS